MKQPLTFGVELVTVGELSLVKAQERVVACQNCSPMVSRSFSSVLVEVLGANSPSTEYLLCAEVACPNCGKPILENSLVRCEGEREEGMGTAFREYEPCWEETNVVLVDDTVLTQAQACVTGCEKCFPAAEITFDYILDDVMERDPTTTEYVLCRTARCPRCNHAITEKTLVTSD